MYLHEDKEQFAQAVNLASYQFSVMESKVGSIVGDMMLQEALDKMEMNF